MTGLKQQEGRDLLIYGHGLLGETLLKHHLLDVLDLSAYSGAGETILPARSKYHMRLVATKSFSKGIVKLTYEPQH